MSDDLWHDVDLYLLLRSGRTGPPSPTGIQLDRLRLGLVAGVLNPSAVEESNMRFAHLAAFFGKLHDFQREVLFASRTPCGVSEHMRRAREGDLHVVVRQNLDGTEERTQETKSGERFLALCRTEEGELEDGWVFVVGMRPVFPTQEELAKLFMVSDWQVKREIRSAKDKHEEWKFENRER